MTIIRKNKCKENPYAQIDRSLIRDHTPPKGVSARSWFGARMLLIVLLDKPDNWRAIICALVKETGLSEDLIYSYMEILIETGYCSRTEYRDFRGRKIKGGVEYVIFESKDAPFKRQILCKKQASYEQESVLEENASTGSYESISGFTRSGKCRSKKNNKERKMKEDPRGPIVHSPTACKQDEPFDPSSLREKISYPLEPSTEAKEKLKSGQLKEEVHFQELFDHFDGDKIEAWVAKIHWSDLYLMFKVAVKKFAKGELKAGIGDEPLYAYLAACVTNRIDNFIGCLSRMGKLKTSYSIA